MSIDAGTLQPVGLFTGQHVLAELEGVAAELLDDEQFLTDALNSALDRSQATVCDVISKRFDPQGVTVLALLSESHASLHSYPENGSIFIDVFTCGNRAQPERAVDLLAESLGPTNVNCRTIRRGHDYETGLT
ncbi:S-adenosylmethionine decarboxylase [Actinopolyspora lacussalsi subsp. righensis]|uniref:S-adenosylmethionine decarboxylase proenzyme n=2 Tax=Actinopolyspora alba group TaxID=2893675 RepID=A0A1I2BUC9_9ACTN|nr:MULTISPECIES: adenosylmethionine decarboxylase [Actinopolyspora alba group]SFE59528.1 S-adenosylmethionine decarboxylase [Actinopolyspora alba]SFT76478.1 S-adenosylmethionine decarboxylase [Actinopolyspora righensis]